VAGASGAASAGAVSYSCSGSGLPRGRPEGSGPTTNAVSLARVIANTAGSALLQPDGIVMHPTNWLTTRLLRDGTGGTAECPNVPDCLPYLYAALLARGAELDGGDDLIPGVSNASGNKTDVLERLDDLAGGLQQPVVTVECSLGSEDGRGLPEFNRWIEELHDLRTHKPFRSGQEVLVEAGNDLHVPLRHRPPVSRPAGGRVERPRDLHQGSPGASAQRTLLAETGMTDGTAFA
jgi:hypothetical protein